MEACAALTRIALASARGQRGLCLWPATAFQVSGASVPEAAPPRKH